MTNVIENWLPVVGYEGLYIVSDFGRVISLERYANRNRWGGKIKVKRRELKYKLRAGYNSVFLTKSANSQKNIPIHRIVAKAFIPNPENKPQVNHKDGNKLNNHASNLEWCTASQNVKHAFDMGLMKPLKRGDNPSAKPLIDTVTGEIFDSCAGAAERFKIKRSTLIAMLTGQNPNKTTLRYYNEFKIEKALLDSGNEQETQGSQ